MELNFQIHQYDMKENSNYSDRKKRRNKHFLVEIDFFPLNWLKIAVPTFSTKYFPHKKENYIFFTLWIFLP